MPYTRRDAGGLLEDATGGWYIVFGSPVHMGYGISGNGQIFLDRTFSLWHEKQLKNKVGGAVAVSKRRGGMNVVNTFNSFMASHQMISAGYATGYGFHPADVKNDPRAFEEAAALGKRISELLQLICSTA
jgi:multimeric flavodoxin WrbA